MSLRKLRTLLLGPALVLSMLAMAAPAEAGPSSPVSICVVVGTVDVDASGQVPPGEPTAGTYTFFDVSIVCAGGISGTASAFSNGSTGPGCGEPFPLPGPGQFCGTYSTGSFLGAAPPVLNGGSCSGRVGGPGVWNPLPPPEATTTTVPPSIPPWSPNADFPTGPWSLTLGNLITGWIDCGTGTSGAIALVAVPIAPNTNPIPVVNPPGGPLIDNDTGLLANNRDCPRTGPFGWPSPVPPGATGNPEVWFCRLLVGGVSVIAG